MDCVVHIQAMIALLGVGMSPMTSALLVVACLAVALVGAAPSFLNGRERVDLVKMALPRGIVALIAGLCLVLFVIEGSVLDWSALFLTQAREVEAAYAGLGCTAFSLTAGRLMGDEIVQRFGGIRVVLLGSLCAASGLLLATLVPAW